MAESNLLNQNNLLILGIVGGEESVLSFGVQMQSVE